MDTMIQFMKDCEPYLLLLNLIIWGVMGIVRIAEFTLKIIKKIIK